MRARHHETQFVLHGRPAKRSCAFNLQQSAAPSNINLSRRMQVIESNTYKNKSLRSQRGFMKETAVVEDKLEEPGTVDVAAPARIQ